MYATLSAAQCAEKLGRTLSATQQRVNVLGLRKSPKWVAERARQRWAEGRHENSRTALASGRGWNKGIKGSTGNHPNCRRTQFKKGELMGAARHNYVPIGSERISKDGYLERKVTDDPALYPARRWVGVHRLVWESTYGPVPPGHAVVFRPGRQTTDAARISVDGLELVSRAELMRRNSYHTRYPKEVAQLIQLKGALNRKINRRTRDRA